MPSFTAKTLQSWTTLGCFADDRAANLYLVCDEGAKGGFRKRWQFRYMRNGRAHRLGLGTAELVSLHDARLKAAELRKFIHEGGDPAAVRQADRLARARSRTVLQAFEGYLAHVAAGWRDPRRAVRLRAILTTHARPLIDRDIASLTSPLVAEVLRPLLAAGKRETAHKLQLLLFATARDARAHGLVSGENVASSDLVNPLLPKGKPRERKHFEAIALVGLPAFMAELRARDGARYRCLEFAILTASRPDMVQAMAWGEVDLTARLWTVPASRMKSERSHVVPLSERAVQILRQLPNAGPFVFGGRKALGKCSANETMKACGRTETAHGTARGGFKTWGTEVGGSRELIEISLAHKLGDASESAYFRGHALGPRARLMEAWSRFLAGESPTSAKVVELKVAG